jgi:type IV fimbrial biogenesis protein FimT
MRAQLVFARTATPRLRHGNRGFTQIELGIVLVVIGILLGFGIPNAQIWLQNMQIRAAAESVAVGLNLARAEALRRNRPVEFVLTDGAPSQSSFSSMVPLKSGRSWVVRIARTDASSILPADFIQARSGEEGTRNVLVDADIDRVVFDGVGTVQSEAAGLAFIRFTNAEGASRCETEGGPYRCLNVTIAPGGAVRTCDPKVSAADPRAC